MEMFNNWLNQIQHNGQGLELYNSTGFVCTILMYAAILLYTWRQKLNPLVGLFIGWLVKFFLVYAQHLMTWYRRDFNLEGYQGTANIGYAFVLLPLLCWLCDITFNITKGTSGELAAISTMAWHFVGRSGCTFSGCCYGINCSWGIYSHYVDGNTFPVCWLESLISLAILIFLLVRFFRRGLMPEGKQSRFRLVNWYRRKRHLPDDGKALPFMLLFYGTGRFFTEFLRHHPEEDILFGFLPEFSIHALLMALVGGLLLYRNYKKEKTAAAKAAEPTLPELSGQRR